MQSLFSYEYVFLYLPVVPRNELWNMAMMLTNERGWPGKWTLEISKESWKRYEKRPWKQYGQTSGNWLSQISPIDENIFFDPLIFGKDRRNQTLALRFRGWRKHYFIVQTSRHSPSWVFLDFAWCCIQVHVLWCFLLKERNPQELAWSWTICLYSFTMTCKDTKQQHLRLVSMASWPSNLDDGLPGLAKKSCLSGRFGELSKCVLEKPSPANQSVILAKRL